MSTNVSEISKYYLEEVLAKGKNFPSGTWKCDEKYENAKNVTKTLIERVLKWTYEDIRNKLTLNIFKKYSVLSMLVKVFNGSPYLAIENAYPGKFKPWEVARVPKNFWNMETAREATIWLIEEKLKWSDEDVKEKLTLNTFKENSLKSMLNYLFNIDPHQPVEMHLKINSKDLTLIFNNNNIIIK